MRFGMWAAAAAALVCSTQASAARYFEFEIKGVTTVQGADATGLNPQNFNVHDDLTLAIDTVATPGGVIGNYTVYGALGELFSRNAGFTQFDLRFDPSTIVDSAVLLPVATTGFYGYQQCLYSCGGVIPGTLLSVTGRTSNVAPTKLGVTDIMSISAVPEPAAWLTMILGFGFVGAALRRTKARARAAAYA